MRICCPEPVGLVVTSIVDVMSPLQIAESIAFDAYMKYHRERLQLKDGLETVDQLRRYEVVDRGDHDAVLFRDGANSGMPKIYAKVNKDAN